MERYRKYKDSGVDWIGEIPEGWGVRRVKTVLRRIAVKGFPDETVLSLYRDYGVVPKDSRDDNFNRTSENTGNYQLVESGNFVVNKMKAWQGSLAVSRYRGIVSPAYFIYRIIDDAIYPRYLHHALRNKDYCAEYRRMSGGIRPGQWDLDPVAFLNLPVVIPTFQEQKAIADYLDEKCSELDSLIAQKQSMLVRLKEYRSALISECVTGKVKVPGVEE